MICLDLNLPDTKGCTGVNAVRAHFPRVPLAVYSASPASDFEEACIEAGADIYIEKAAGSTELAAALRGLLLADPTSEFGAASNAAAEDHEASTKLSKRQTQLIVMLERGLTNREIGEELDISEHTVKVAIPKNGCQEPHPGASLRPAEWRAFKLTRRHMTASTVCLEFHHRKNAPSRLQLAVLVRALSLGPKAGRGGRALRRSVR